MEYDFKTPIEKTGTQLAYAILDEVNKHKELLIPTEVNRTDEEQKAFEKGQDEKTTDFAISILKIIASTDMPADYASYPIEKIIAVLAILKNYIDGSVRQSHDEIMSRFLGAKSPKTGKYAKDCAPFQTIVLKLQEIREATGNKPEDYFTNVAPENK